MSFNNNLIQAAINLGLTTLGVYYKLNNNNTIIISEDGSENINVTASIISRAKYLNKLHEIRLMRDQRLAESDWRLVSDSPLSSEEKTLWRTYRQSLRDCTSTLVEGNENEFTYPASPLASDT